MATDLWAAQYSAVTPSTLPEPRQSVAIIGGAVAGAQLALMLAEAGIEVAVFEQNRRPFGKIEDGLPRWHTGLRHKEYGRIVERLSHERIHFVPHTRIGEDIGFADLLGDWGFGAVVLACGAWRDRPLPIDGAESWIDKGLVYQNPFIVSFNHGEDPNYDGPTYDIPDDSVVVGGGLASIDVIKVLMLETTRKKLAELGHEIDVESLEKAGMDRTCEGFGIKWDDLGLKGSTLYYRRQPQDMPLQAMPDDADATKRDKVLANREKMLNRSMAKYKFRFEGLSSPEQLIIEDDKVVGVRFRRMQKGEGRTLIKTDEVIEARGNLVVSSIGSIPSPIEGVSMKGELFAFTDWDLGRLDGQPRVFSVGNVVTGKGNIVSSRRHAASVGERLLESYLGLSAGQPHDEDAIIDKVADRTSGEAESIKSDVKALPELSAAAIAQIRQRIKARQDEVGYDGDLAAWVAAEPPA